MNLNKLNFRKDINALRAFCVLGVIFYHSNYFKVENGYLGVDVFFVISGYLIGYKIIYDLYLKNFSFKNFYIGRIKRLAPSLILTLLLSIILFILFFFPNDVSNYKDSLLTASLYLSNIYFWRNTNYFFESTSTQLLAHTWSLSLEEQFYLLLPIGLFLVFKYFNKYLKASLIVVALTSVVLFLTPEPFVEMTKFYLLPARLFQFLIGVIVAHLHLTVPNQRRFYNPKLKLFVSIFLIFLIFLPIEIINKQYYLIMTTLFAVLFIYFLDQNKFLNFAFIEKIGLSSYSIYLIHYLYFSIDNYLNLYVVLGIKQLFIDVILIILSLLTGFLIYNYFENPIRRSKNISNKSIIMFSIFSTLILIVVSTTNVVDRVVSKPFEKINIVSERNPTDLGLICVITEDIVLNVNDCTKDYDPIKSNFLIIGDSIANTLYWGIKDNISENQTISLFSVTECVALVTDYGPLLTNKREEKCLPNWYKIKEEIELKKFDKILVAYDYGHIYKNEGLKQLFFDELINLNKKNNVVIIGKAVHWDNYIERSVYLDIKQQNKNINSYTDKRLNTFLTFELEEEYKDLITSLDIKYFSLVDIFCKNYLCSRYEKIDNIYYINFVDRIHLTFSGSKLVAREIVKLFN